MNIDHIKNKFIGFKAELKMTLNSLEEKEKEYNELKVYNENLQKARAIVSEAGKFTQTYLKDYIEEMVSTALQAVFEEDYKFVIEFEIKRNQVECKLKIKINEQEMDFKDCVGGGIIDVTSFALRIVLWSIQNPKTDNVIILDEPFHFIHGKLENAMKMLKDLSKKLNIQFIIVSQLEELSEGAEKIFSVKHNGKFSEVKEL